MLLSRQRSDWRRTACKLKRSSIAVTLDCTLMQYLVKRLPWVCPGRLFMKEAKLMMRRSRRRAARSARWTHDNSKHTTRDSHEEGEQQQQQPAWESRKMDQQSNESLGEDILTSNVVVRSQGQERGVKETPLKTSTVYHETHCRQKGEERQ